VTAEEVASPEYWCRHIRETVRFEESIQTLADAGIEVFVEIGPGCTLSAMGRRCWPTEAATWLPSLRKGRTDWQQMLASLGSLYVRGVEVDWVGFDQDYPRCRLPLPTYPFQRQRYWIETPSKKPVSELQTEEQPVPDFSQVREEANVISQNQSLRDAVLAVDCNDRQTWLVSYLSQQLTEVVGLSLSKADLQQSLRNLGLDSLMIAELKSQFEADLGISLPIVELLEGPSVVHIAEKLNRQLTLAQSVTEFSQSALTSVLRLPKTDSTAWIVRYKPNPQARMRLFCFPYAGGGASIFRTWSDELPQWIEVCAIQLPGREERIREQPFTCLTSLVETLAQVLLPELDKPFAFYGHSMGALLSFELARYLCTHRGKSPVHLFVAACLAPQLPNPFRFISQSSDLVLLELLHYFGTPMSILNNTEIMQALLPTIKADFQALSQYAGCKKELLKCSISAFGGGQDKIVSHDAIAAWQERTNSNFNLQVFPGEHLFLESERPLLLSAISQELSHSAFPKLGQPLMNSLDPVLA
ncbi:MAG: thioesterase domain-containing protein, partial [Cyanobacteriota bacterium]